MPIDDERIKRLEGEVRSTQDNVLLIHKDLQQMSTGITKMASSMEVMANIQMNIKVLEERCEARNTERKEDRRILHLRIDDRESEIKVIIPQAAKGETAFSIIKWIGITFGTLLIGSIFGSYLWAIAMQGAK